MYNLCPENAQFVENTYRYRLKLKSFEILERLGVKTESGWCNVLHHLRNEFVCRGSWLLKACRVQIRIAR